MLIQENTICSESRVYSMHDERLSKIEIGDDELRLVFDSLLRPYKGATKCVLRFRGFDDIDYDVQFFSLTPDLSIQSDKHLNLIGKKYWLHDLRGCMDDFFGKNRPLMVVTDIFVSDIGVLVKGVPYETGNFSHSDFAIYIESKEFSYLWMQ